MANYDLLNTFFPISENSQLPLYCLEYHGWIATCHKKTKYVSFRTHIVLSPLGRWCKQLATFHDSLNDSSISSHLFLYYVILQNINVGLLLKIGWAKS
jgi:hypothetical protein